MKERKKLLDELLNFEQPIGHIKTALAEFPWDSDVELAFLSARHFENLLKLYLDDSTTVSEVESWANAIEGRDDIGFASDNKKILRELIHELANPLLTQPLTKKRARELLNQLGL